MKRAVKKSETMKIQEGIQQGIDLNKVVDVDATITVFDKYQSILKGFQSKYPELKGSEKQVRWAEELREKEVRIATKMIFASIYQRELKKVVQSAQLLYSDDRINKIGNALAARIKSFTHAAQWIQATKESWV